MGGGKKSERFLSGKFLSLSSYFSPPPFQRAWAAFFAISARRSDVIFAARLAAFPPKLDSGLVLAVVVNVFLDLAGRDLWRP